MPKAAFRSTPQVGSGPPLSGFKRDFQTQGAIVSGRTGKKGDPFMGASKVDFDELGPVKTRHRFWIPFAIACLAAVAIVAIRLQSDFERNFKDWLTIVIMLLAVVLGLIWFLLLSRFSGRVRLGTFIVLALASFGLAKLLRVAGTVSGNGLPRLVWRWTPSQAPLSNVPPTDTLRTNPLDSTRDILDSPQFLGPNRNGIITGIKLAGDWTATPPKQLWRQPVGAGWSAFAVVGNRAYTQEQRGESECVTCYELLSGHLLWVHSNSVHFDQWQGGDGPRATPTVDQGQVFAMGATGVLDCLDAITGQRLWSHNVLSENHLANLTWGVSVSPLVFEDTVVVTGGLTNGSTVLAYRRSTGEPLWRSGSDKADYASPVLAMLAGKRLVLSVNAASLTAHDPITGELLLNHPWSNDKWPKASQPVVIGSDRVFLSAGYGTGCELLRIQMGSNGKLVATQLWHNLRMKTQFNSAVARDGFLYGLDDGSLACIEIATGERKWKEGHYGSGQTLLEDDLVIVQSELGPVFLVQVKPDGCRELGRIAALSSKTWNYPTLAGKYLLVRNNQEMACYELPLAGQPSAMAGR
jgi:outer membrane protein assembly factor BamB